MDAHGTGPGPIAYTAIMHMSNMLDFWLFGIFNKFFFFALLFVSCNGFVLGTPGHGNVFQWVVADVSFHICSFCKHLLMHGKKAPTKSIVLVKKCLLCRSAVFHSPIKKSVVELYESLKSWRTMHLPSIMYSSILVKISPPKAKILHRICI